MLMMISLTVAVQTCFKR